jgi:hypothetical protein
MKVIPVIAILFLIIVTVLIFPGSADQLTLTDNEKSFLSDLVSEGIPLLYQAPEAMDTGVYFGKDTAITDISTKEKDLLDKFTTNISAYSLGSQTSALRSSYMKSADILKTDLEKYSTLVPGCGSCITEMNSMYPELIKSAESANKDVIRFYQKNQISL